MIVYEGPSLLDGTTPVVAVLTGVERPSVNRKVGWGAAHLWILRADTHPVDAADAGLDTAVCGDCPHRGRATKGPGRRRTCYVTLAKAPTTIWRRYAEGGYQRVSPSAAAAFLPGRLLRLGAYGDPAALPLAVLETLAEGAASTVGYTMQWRDGFALAHLCMASCGSWEEAEQARAYGYRAFVALPGSDPAPAGAMQCPNEATRHRPMPVTCSDCRACGGTGSGTGSAHTTHVQIGLHGPAARRTLPVVRGPA